MKREEKLRRGYKCAAYMLVATFLLAALKFFVGWLTGSIVITADAMHSLTDVIVLFVAFIGIAFAHRPPSKKFPYGYYKAESIASFLISFFIILIALTFFYEGYKRIFEIGKIEEAGIAILTAAFSSLISYAMALYIGKVGRETGMGSLMATSNERKMDSISSLVVMLAIILQVYHIKYVEGIVTMGIASLIFKTGIISFKDAIATLMDVSPSGIERKIGEILKNSSIKGYRDLKLRKAGPFIFGEVKLTMDGNMNVDEAHEIADEIEKKIKGIEGIDDFITHIEPTTKRVRKVAIPVDSENKIADKFGRAKYFLILRVDDKGWKKIAKIENKYEKKKVRAGLAAANLLEKNGVNEVITKDIGEIAYYALKEKNVKIFYGEGSINEIMEKYMNGQIELFKKPKKVE